MTVFRTLDPSERVCKQMQLDSRCKKGHDCSLGRTPRAGSVGIRPLLKDSVKCSMKTAMLRSISALWLVFTTAAFSQTVITTISVGTQPLGVAVNQKTNTVYVSNYQDNSVSVINAATNTVVATVAVGKGPQAILAYTPANLVYVNNVTDRTISVINGSTNTVVNTVKAPPITTWAQLGNSNMYTQATFRRALSTSLT